MNQTGDKYYGFGWQNQENLGSILCEKALKSSKIEIFPWPPSQNHQIVSGYQAEN
jgi:hypothetical protein